MLTGASESASSSNKPAFGGQINPHSHSSPKKCLYLYMAVENCGIGHLLLENSKKIGIPLYVGMLLGALLGKNAESDTAEKIRP